MQTTGAALLGVKECSLARMWLPAQDGHSAPGLLYVPAVRTGGRKQERRQGTVDIDPSLISEWRSYVPAG
jgi:hypothetical protein